MRRNLSNLFWFSIFYCSALLPRKQYEAVNDWLIKRTEYAVGI